MSTIGGCNAGSGWLTPGHRLGVPFRTEHFPLLRMLASEAASDGFSATISATFIVKVGLRGFHGKEYAQRLVLIGE